VRKFLIAGLMMALPLAAAAQQLTVSAAARRFARQATSRTHGRTTSCLCWRTPPFPGRTVPWLKPEMSHGPVTMGWKHNGCAWTIVPYLNPAFGLCWLRVSSASVLWQGRAFSPPDRCASRSACGSYLSSRKRQSGIPKANSICRRASVRLLGIQTTTTRSGCRRFVVLGKATNKSFCTDSPIGSSGNIAAKCPRAILSLHIAG